MMKEKRKKKRTQVRISSHARFNNVVLANSMHVFRTRTPQMHLCIDSPACVVHTRSHLFRTHGNSPHLPHLFLHLTHTTRQHTNTPTPTYPHTHALALHGSGKRNHSCNRTWRKRSKKESATRGRQTAHSYNRAGLLSPYPPLLFPSSPSSSFSSSFPPLVLSPSFLLSPPSSLGHVISENRIKGKWKRKRKKLMICGKSSKSMCERRGRRRRRRGRADRKKEEERG